MITLTINRRLQLYFTLFALALLLTMAIVMNMRVKSDFIDYLNDEKHHSLNQLAKTLQNEYAQNEQSWRTLLARPHLYERAVDEAFSAFLSSSNTTPPPPLGKTHPPPHKNAPPPKPPQRPALPVGLEDMNGHLLYGRGKAKADTHFLSPIKNASGDIIAQVTLPKNSRFSGAEQQAFLREINRTLWAILAFGCVLSLVLARVLAKTFTQPIEQLSHAVTALKNRQFSTRIVVHREDEFGQLSHAFNDMMSKLETYESQQRTWLGHISHDLRTPVAVLKAEVDAVLDGVRASNADTFASLAHEINSLSLMLDNFHQMAINDIQNTQHSPLNPTPILHELARHSEHSCTQAGLTLHTQWDDTPTQLNISELALTQIWQNLMQNSLRYTQADGAIHIETKTQNKHWILDWQDTAPSVTDAQLKQLTQPLFRAEQSRNRAFAGSGLGLSIVQDIITRAGGSIELTQSPLGGLRVSLFFAL